jgi:hypothetical protein
MNAGTLAELALKVWGLVQVMSGMASLPGLALFTVAVFRGDTSRDGFIRVSQQVNMLMVVGQVIAGIIVPRSPVCLLRCECSVTVNVAACDP